MWLIGVEWWELKEGVRKEDSLLKTVLRLHTRLLDNAVDVVGC